MDINKLRCIKIDNGQQGQMKVFDLLNNEIKNIDDIQINIRKDDVILVILRFIDGKTETTLLTKCIIYPTSYFTNKERD